VSTRCALGFAHLAVAAGVVVLGACTLDFDRYDPVDAGSAPDASIEASPDVGTPTVDAPTVDATAEAAPVLEASSDAPADRESGACTPPPDCIQQATACGAACGQVYQGCAQDCDAQACVDACRTSEQSCLGKCISVCISCTADGGCSASNPCLNASHP